MKRIIGFLLILLAGPLAYGQAVNFPPCTGAITANCTDYFGVANYANSPLPVGAVDVTATGFTILSGGTSYSAGTTATVTDFYNTPGATGAAVAVVVDPATGAITGIAGVSAGSGYVAPVVNVIDPNNTGSGALILAKLSPVGLSGGIRKFVASDLLPTLPLAAPDKTTFPSSDYYEIALVEYTQQMHADLPPTALRGYVQVPTGTVGCPAAAAPTYLGPVILAQKGVPVRVKFTNCLPTTAFGGNLQIPADTTYMGAGNGPDGTPYSQNRATLHLHGGNTPWISDGTPHQWTVPAGEATNFPKGVSTQSVPDMYFSGSAIVPQCTAAVIANCSGGTAAQLPPGATNDPGAGSMTFYWTNQQGGRLMFYHDHAYGITRLNVYAGEAAGYLLYDPAEEAALLAAGVPGTVATNALQTAPDLGHLIPMVIQDKSFVPAAAQLAGEDPTWAWGSGAVAPGVNGNGDLWYPHVYMTNQNPADPGGANAFGRWDYGAWFFPPQTTLSAATAGPLGPNTAVTVPCTSAAFPNVTLQPTAADNYKNGCPITPNPSGTPEAFMDTPLVNGKAYPVLHVSAAAYRLRILNAANDRTLNLGLFQACGGTSTYTTAATNCAITGAAGTEVPLVPAVRGGLGTSGYVYPDQLDGRDSGVPDSTAAGPPFIQIGSEGGLLPAVAVVRPVPVGFEYNRRSITVLNVSSHGLLLGPAERADAVVDFTAFAGKTLILYNDAPAPVPAFDSRIDYYTGDLDQVATGGAPATLPGYGPNTRTIMQIVVDGTTPNTTAFILANVQAALPAIFSGSNATTPMQAIVPEPSYPVASGGHSATGTYGRISDNTITYTPLGAVGPVTLDYGQKAIQELFTLDYGRMNATLGTELPLTNFLAQTTLPYGYAEWETEIIRDSKDPTVPPQIWKLTHNGVDTHFIHFHLFNVQVINRVGWDGAVKQPDPNELGWKDTVRMNPLEDIVVALQPVSQQLPFPLPDSIRSLDPTLPDGAADPIMSGIDPATGNAIPGGLGTFNARVNFGWEYVWHCHILGHEENDMMRPIIFQVAPPAPSSFSAVFDAGGSGQVTLSWTDNSASETGFTIERDVTAAFAAPVPVFTNTNSSNPNTAYGLTLTSIDAGAPKSGPVFYRLRAEDDFTPRSPLAAPFQTVPLSSTWVATQAGYATVTAILAPAVTYGQDGTVTVSVTAAQPVTGNVTLSVDGGSPTTLALAGGSAVFTVLKPTAGNHTLAAAFAAQGTFAASSATGVLLVNQAPLTITASSATLTYGSPIPVITPSVTGLVNGDLVSSLGTIACTTTATQASVPGPYPTTCSGAVNANYSITYVPGAITITAAPLTITANSAARPYGSANPVFTALYSGFVLGQTSASLTGTLSCASTAVAASPVGSYPITCSGQTSATYNITYVAGTLTVSRVPLTITANNVTRPIGTPNPALTATYAGFVNGDTAASLTGTLTCTTTATAASPAGVYPIVCSGQSSNNYTITYVAGVLTVTAAGPVLTVTPTALTFSAPVNVTTASQSVTVSNSGIGALRINSITLGGVNPGRFGQSNTCPIGLPGLAAGATCTVNVTFTPNNATNRSALLNVNVAAPAASRSVTLTGTTVQPTVSVTPASIAFGNQLINTTSPPHPVTFRNTGTVPVIISGITMAGANPTRFAQTSNCPIGGAGLAAGASCTINVTFTANRRVARSAALRITDNAAGSPQTVTLTGTGI